MTHVAPLDIRYQTFFDLFNRQQFFEAHEVLESLWLPQRCGPNGAFYKGLIQVAGAFVHVQKGRPGPAAALLRLARGYLAGYPARHESLDVAAVLRTIETWLERIEPGQFEPGVLERVAAPRLALLPPADAPPSAGDPD